MRKGATYVWDAEQMVPYAYLDDQWVGFDDERSIRWVNRPNSRSLVVSPLWEFGSPSLEFGSHFYALD